MPPPSQSDAAVLERLPDPAMVVEGAARGEVAGLRIVFANAAARELFRLRAEGQGAAFTVYFPA